MFGFVALLGIAFVSSRNLYAVDYQLSASSKDATKGSVSGTVDGAYTEKTTVTLTATPEEGFTFTRWDGVPPALRLDNPLSFALTNDTTVTAVFGKTYHVATTGNDATTDGINPDTPFLTIEKAVAAVADDDTIFVGEGTFKGTAELFLTKAITLRGSGMDKTIRTAQRINLNNADLIVADLRMTGYSGGGTITFTSGGAGGTLLRCDVSGNTRTSTVGTGIYCYIGNIVQCVITNNLNKNGGSGVGIYIVGGPGPTLIEDCLISKNTTTYGGTCAGVFVDATTLNSVIIRGCTIADNLGGNECGGLELKTCKANILVENCVIGGNNKFNTPTASQTDDACIGTPSAGYHYIFRNSVIGKMPTTTANGSVVIENCITNVNVGFRNLLAGDYRIGRNSPAWGLAENGTDAGYYQSEHTGTFDVGGYSDTFSARGSAKAILTAVVENAPQGECTIEWDFDNDGTFDATGTEVTNTFTKLGFNSVTVKATVGEESKTRLLENIVSVLPKEIFVWSQSPAPAYPYATWQTAAHNVNDALAVAIDDCKVQLTNELQVIASTMNIHKKIELCGTGMHNNSEPHANNAKLDVIDANAKGTAVGRRTGDIVVLRINRPDVLVHSLALGPGRPNIVVQHFDSVISNCVIRNGNYTGGDGVGIHSLAGLITHCVISNNYNYNSNCRGGEVYLNKSILRNSLVTGGRHTSSEKGGNFGSVYAENGATVENCTIVGNTSGTGAGLFTKGKVYIYNNIIRDNIAKCDTSSVGSPDWYTSNTDNYDLNKGQLPTWSNELAIWSNNCTVAAFKDGDSTVTLSPSFNVGTGLESFTFEAASPCINKGVLRPWMTENATDLFGNKRVQGGAPDIGCFEADMSQASLDFSVKPDIIVDNGEATLEATLVGGTVSGTIKYLWDIDGDGETDYEGETIKHTFTYGEHPITLTVLVDGEEYLTTTKEKGVSVYSSVMYLAAENENATFPYNTPETAATDLSTLLGIAQENAVITILEGTHDIPFQITPSKAITLKAAEGLKTRPVLDFTTPYNAGSTITINNGNTLVEGLHFNSMGSPRAVEISAGTMRDCIISNVHYTSGWAIGINATGGLIDRCEFIKVGGTDQGEGLVAVLDGTAVMRNCLVHKNQVDNATDSKKGVIRIKGNATLENCTIVSNSCGKVAAVYCDGNAKVINNIIWGNYFRATPSAAYLGGADWQIDGSGVVWSNNCAKVAYQEGDKTVTSDPLFKDPLKLDWRLKRNSPCYSRGVFLDWMTDTADFAGNPRVFGLKPDIGAYELQVGAGTIIVIK